MLQISTAELAAKAEETRGQLRHLDQQVGLELVFVVTDRQMSSAHMAVSACLTQDR